MPTALDNGRRSPSKLLLAVVVRLLGRKPEESETARLLAANRWPSFAAAAGVANSLGDNLNVTVVQGLPDAQIEVDFEASLLIVKFVREIDTKHVRC